MQESLRALSTSISFASSYKELSDYVSDLGPNVLWVVDENTSKMVRPLPQPNVILKSGEAAKTWESVQAIVERAIAAKLSRSSTFLAFGGGVVSDITAFAASIYMRGCNLVLVPTTLLAMVDACLGGKTAVNFSFAKNMIGTFYPASHVIICPQTLDSLPKSDYLSGLAELLKHSLLSRTDSLMNLIIDKRDLILHKDKDTLSQIILESLRIKSEFVIQDPRETNGLRTFLNLGHTFAHALEAHSRGAWTHGQAVAWGIGRALEAGVRMSVTDPDFARLALRLFSSFGYQLNYRIGRGQWLDFQAQLFKDKKRDDDGIAFVLIKSQGQCVMAHLKTDLVRDLVLEPPLV
ncbi:MAG: 3-dehydroquinate synthase family protein [Sphaerochaetaceae bacterium]|jgi:3-dehydroquinate synthase